MTITINISDSELSQTDKTLVKDCLGLVNDTQLNDALSKLCKSGLMEYINMFKEKGLPNRADEVKQERLFFLLKFFFKDRLPSENEISSIFQLTPSQSRTLLRNTKSRYRMRINSYIKNTLLSYLNSAILSRDNNMYEFICTSPTIIEEINLIISQKGPELQPIERIKGLASKYICAVDTYNLLQQELS